jgi:hypothetical protein
MRRKLGNTKFYLPILVFALANVSLSTAGLESAIDRLVYQLYDLNPSEIALIEKAI